MTVKGITKLMKGPDLICIRDDREIFYAGYLGMLEHFDQSRRTELMALKVRDLRIETDIRHKDWKKLGLEEPILPDQAPKYSFTDLVMELYMTIYVESVKE